MQKERTHHYWWMPFLVVLAFLWSKFRGTPQEEPSNTPRTTTGKKEEGTQGSPPNDLPRRRTSKGSRIATNEPSLVISVLVIGEEGSGKTSILQRVVGDSAEGEELPIPSVLAPIRLTRDNIALDLVDTSAADEWSSKMNREINEADFIFMVYDINKPSSIRLFETKWLPKIKALRGRAMPVLAVLATKADNAENLDGETIKSIISMDENIEFVVACSAKTGKNVDIIWLSYQLIANPISCLFSSRARKQYSPKFDMAIKDMFFFFSKEGTVLGDAGLHTFHKFMWHKEAKDADIAQLRAFLAKISPDCVSEDGTGLTELGFGELLRFLITKEKIGELWAALRKFGYTNKLDCTGVRSIE